MLYWPSLSSSTPRLQNKQFSSVFTVSTEYSAINNYFTKYEHYQLWQLVFSIRCQLMALSTTTKNDSFITVDYFWQLLLHCVTVRECCELFGAWGENTNRITAKSCCNCTVYDVQADVQWCPQNRHDSKAILHSGVPRNFFRGGFNKFSWGQRTERTGIWGHSPQSGVLEAAVIGTRNFISYSKIFLIFGTLRLFMMTTNVFVIANVKQLRT